MVFKMYDLIIIGGGATGTVAGISASLRNKKVLIIEKKDRILKKVLTTGNGQCNFTNINASSTNYHSVESENISKEIIDKLFLEYSPKKIINFFNDLGVLATEKNRGKMYPSSFKASSIVDSIRFKLESLNVDIMTNTECVKVEKKSHFIIHTKDNSKYFAKNVLIATGGITSFDSNDSKSIYFIIENSKHKKTKLIPSIVQLKTDNTYVKGLEGIKVNVNIDALYNDKIIDSDYGELLFTTYGISGPTVFNLSYLVAKYKINDLVFNIDFMPNYNFEDVVDLLSKRNKNLKYLMYDEFLSGILPKKLGQFLIKKIGIEKLNQPVNFTEKDIYKLAKILKKYEIKIIETTGFKNAQVTAGGISLKEIDKKTFESKYIKNLYLAGEILDLHGECGGFNLQWCFASGLKIGNDIE